MNAIYIFFNEGSIECNMKYRRKAQVPTVRIGKMLCLLHQHGYPWVTCSKRRPTKPRAASRKVLDSINLVVQYYLCDKKVGKEKQKERQA